MDETIFYFCKMKKKNEVKREGYKKKQKTIENIKWKELIKCKINSQIFSVSEFYVNKKMNGNEYISYLI